MNREIILCADDYAQNEPISEGILLLAQNQRINAISCLVNLPYWEKAHTALQRIKHDLFIGLHVNLSFGRALSAAWEEKYTSHFGSFFSLIQQSYFRHLDRECVEAEINAQLNVFIDATGMPPDFIDGHQHIHQLPIIRDAFISVYKQRNLTAFCRNTSNDWKDLFSLPFPKRQAIALLGGLGLKKRLKKHAILRNTSFAGIYDFAAAKNYRAYFKQFLKQSDAGGLIMCHPGKRSTDPDDPLHRFRHYELSYLMSDAFLSDLHEQQCRLQRKLLL